VRSTASNVIERHLLETCESFLGLQEEYASLRHTRTLRSSTVRSAPLRYRFRGSPFVRRVLGNHAVAAPPAARAQQRSVR